MGSRVWLMYGADALFLMLDQSVFSIRMRNTVWLEEVGGSSVVVVTVRLVVVVVAGARVVAGLVAFVVLVAAGRIVAVGGGRGTVGVGRGGPSVGVSVAGTAGAPVWAARTP